MSTDPERYLQAMQDVLAGEHAALWAAGRAAGTLTGAQRNRALVDLEEHRDSRDELRRRIVAAGAGPVPAAAAYQLPFPVTGASSARKLLAYVNQQLCPLYAQLAGAAAPGARRWPVGRAQASAVRAVRWGAEPAPFPGA